MFHDNKSIVITQTVGNKSSLNTDIVYMLEDAASKLHEISTVKKRSVNISSLFLVSPITEEDLYALDINYWINDKKYDQQTEKNYLWSLENKVSKSTNQLLEQQNQKLNCLTVRMPQGKNQWDSISLLKLATKTVKDLGNVEILDIIYHSFIDNDALDHPFIRIYYNS